MFTDKGKSVHVIPWKKFYECYKQEHLANLFTSVPYPVKCNVWLCNFASFRINTSLQKMFCLSTVNNDDKKKIMYIIFTIDPCLS